MITAGALAFSGEVSDRFGGYGTVVLAIVVPDTDNRTAALDTFLMSCRTMGRGVECAFIDHVIRALAKRGITKLSATFLPTQKNKPAESFLPDHGFITVSDGEGGVHAYELDIAHYADHPCRKVNLAITIKQPEHGHS
jgi:predicted enzyme involved in methoxymalonyl-ACP biosynthesis